MSSDGFVLFPSWLCASVSVSVSVVFLSMMWEKGLHLLHVCCQVPQNHLRVTGLLLCSVSSPFITGQMAECAQGYFCVFYCASFFHMCVFAPDCAALFPVVFKYNWNHGIVMSLCSCYSGLLLLLSLLWFYVNFRAVFFGSVWKALSILGGIQLNWQLNFDSFNNFDNASSPYTGKICIQ